MSRIDVSTTAVLVSNVPTIQLYKYEPFNNVFSVKSGFLASDKLTANETSGDILGFISSNVSSTVLSFSSSNGLQASTSNLALVINDVCDGTVRETLRYTVNVGAGRFTAPASGATLSLYRNEPIFYTDSSRTFIASIPITQPITTPALPTGLQFDGSGTTYNLSGTPILQSPARDYTVIGNGSADPSKIVTTKVRISIGAERMVVDLSGNTSVTDMTIGSSIVQRAMFARCPPYPLAGSNVFYSWSALPEGLYFANASGVPVSSPYLATDASSTLLLKGTPTEYAARTLSIPFVTNVTVSRRTLPSISSNVQYSFSFVPTVLFNPLGTFSNQYVNAASRLSNASNRFFAYTRFGTDVSITDISTVTSLPADLDLSFNSVTSEAYIVGTPFATSSANYTVRATDASGNTRDISFNLTVLNDAVTFNPLDISTFTFVVARALSNFITGYYPYPIQFSATSAAGCNVTYSASGLPNGIDISSNGLLSGTPTEVSSRTSYTVTGTASGTNASNTTIFDASVLAEQFYWPTQTLAFFQNIPITPIQFRVTTLSERPIVSFSSTTEPLGLNLNSTGRLTGTPASNVSGTMLIGASTGLATDTRAYPYTVEPEKIAMYTSQSSYPLVPGTPISIPVNSVAYSGQTVSNFRFSNLDISYGLGINPTTGIISGTPNSNIYYILDCNAFVVKGSVGLADGQLGARIVTADYYRPRYFAGAVAGSNFKCVYSDLNPYAWQPSLPVINMVDSAGGNDFQNANGVFLVPNPTGEYPFVFRSTNGTWFYEISSFSGGMQWWMSSTAHKTGTNKWWGVGIRYNLTVGGDDFIAVLYTSIDNGLTWNVDDAPEISATTFQTRDANFAPYNGFFIDPTRNAYLRAGAAIAYKNGVLMVGGLLKRYGFGSALRSTDEGLTWSNIPTSFARETAFINTDNSGIWVMTGSDLYSSADDNPDSFTVDTTTIRYSTDQGETWSPAVGDFNMLAYNITYASNTWIATGLDCVRGDVPTYTPGARFSTDGSNWSLIQLPATMSNTERYVPPLPISPFSFDGSWNTIVDTGGITPMVLYAHDTCATTFTNSVDWIGTDVTSQFDIGSRLSYFTNPKYASPSVPSSTLQFPTVGAGAAITSPASSYLFYQFVPIEPIVFASALPGATFFVTGVPIGFSYNPVTQTLTGTPCQLGHSSFQVTARDSGGVGITTLTVSINVVIPRVVRPQSGAGAYTSLVRQYVEVNAAQNSRDKKVLPGEPLGEFMAPPAPDKISDVICCPPTN